MNKKKPSKDDKFKKTEERIRELNLRTSKFESAINKNDNICRVCGRKDHYSKLSGKCIFHCKKEDWYSVDTKNEKKWNQEKVNEFWGELHGNIDLIEKMSFNHFVFPKFSENSFWKEKEEKIFKKDAVFSWCTFLDDICFFKVKFKGALIFFFCDTYGNADFRNVEFSEFTDFAKNEFKSTVYFSESCFKDSGKFSENKILKDIYLSNSIFRKNFQFTHNVIEKKAELSLIKCAGAIDFMATEFKGNVTFWLSQFNKANFEGVIFPKDYEVLFQDTLLGHSIFSHIIFTQNIIFRRSHLEFTTFLDSKIDQAQFSECYFNDFFKRKSLFDEILIRTGKKEKKKNKEVDKKIIRFLEKVNSDITSSKDYEEVEELNRQLKKNFEEKKDYESAGDFHIGEMDMRRRRFSLEIKEKNYGKNWVTKKIFHAWSFLVINPARRFLLFWYWVFSEYGEKPGRVFNWFFLVPFFAFLYFVSFEFQDFGRSFEFALTSFIPLLPKNIEIDTLNWIQRSIFYFETIISAILWFLLLLSIRRKFRR